ncbi:hypothetical protein MPSEU_000971400 [Mayamaea pseudoterrestris]|nr:hypothetical protein MPSEU_000971400 [Mayamaea pseudoterrestris]
MPIDLRPFAQDESLWNALELSLELRGATANDDDDEPSLLVAQLRQAHGDTRRAKQQLELYRSQYKRKQVTDRHKLQNLELSFRQAEDTSNHILSRVPNYVDSEIPTFIDKDDESEWQTADNQQTRTHNDETVNQIMFCIGGYEQLGTHIILTGRGRGLLQAMEQYMIESCQEMPAVVKSEVLDMPLMLPIDAASYQKRCGVVSPFHQCLSDGSIMAPSWMSLVEHHLPLNDTYFDRSLPQSFLLSCTDCMHRTPPTLQTQRQSSWYRDLPLHQDLQVLLVTGPSLSIDSRRLQISWMEHLRDVYQQLAPTSRLRIRSIQPADLSSAEASRLVLESYMPTTGSAISSSSKVDNQLTIELASTSNLLDYCSDGLKHGNSMDKGNVHLLHGSVCNVGFAVEWMLQHCKTVDHGCQGILLPNCIQHGAEINFCRRFIKKKGGKQFVQAIPLPAQQAVVAPTSGHDANATFGSGSDDVCGPTIERIRKEAASCPFDFLPFYK